MISCYDFAPIFVSRYIRKGKYFSANWGSNGKQFQFNCLKIFSKIKKVFPKILQRFCGKETFVD